MNFIPNRAEGQILAGLAAAAKRLAELAALWKRDPGSRPFGRDNVELLTAVEELPEFGVRVNVVGWLGEEGSAARKRGQRALERLAEAGLIERIARWGDRASHAKLTAVGAALVEQKLHGG